jgi:hypothetical protein
MGQKWADNTSRRHDNTTAQRPLLRARRPLSARPAEGRPSGIPLGDRRRATSTRRPRRHSTRQRDNTATRRHADATGRGHAGRTTYTRARPRRDAPTGPTASHQPSGAPMTGPLFPPPSPAPLPNPARGVNFALACLPTTGARTARHPFAVSSRTSRQGAASTRPSLAATGGVLRRQTRAGRTTHTHKHIYERDETDQQAQWGDHPSIETSHVTMRDDGGDVSSRRVVTNRAIVAKPRHHHPSPRAAPRGHAATAAALRRRGVRGDDA